MDKAVIGEDIILKSKGQQRYSYVEPDQNNKAKDIAAFPRRSRF